MKRNSMDKLIGKYCKIVTKEPGEDRAHVVSGIVKDIDYDIGLLFIESEQGPGCLNLKAIVAIKPGKNLGLAHLLSFLLFFNHSFTSGPGLLFLMIYIFIK
jgi:hypothetical protein